MRMRELHVGAGAILFLMLGIIVASVLFITEGGTSIFQGLMNDDPIVEAETADSLTIDYIGPRYVPEKEAQIRELNENMATFLNANDLE